MILSARECHQPKNHPIYVAKTDYDAQVSDLLKIESYIKGVRSVVMPEGYLLGTYGNGLVCQTLMALGLVHYSWLSMSKKWTGSGEYTGWSLNQLGGGNVCGVPCDFNESTGAAGGWMPYG